MLDAELFTSLVGIREPARASPCGARSEEVMTLKDWCSESIATLGRVEKTNHPGIECAKVVALRALADLECELGESEAEYLPVTIRDDG